MNTLQPVVIVGGGIVGATCACAIAQADIDVILLDRFNFQRCWQDNSIDLRVSALTQASQNILKTLGVWEAMVERGVCPYKTMRVWDTRADGSLHFDSADTAFDQLGHIVENRVTTAALWDRLESLPAARCISNVSVTQVIPSDSGHVLVLDDGRKIYTELVIAADGRDSSLRSMLGIDVICKPYHQDGLVATVNTENCHQFTAWQRFLEEGPLAFLPLHTGQCSIVWTLKTTTAQTYLQLDEQAFLKQLEKASGGILGHVLKVSEKAAFPLFCQHAKRYVARGFALVGDSAHAIHPLAGQGANAGLLDAAALVELIIKAHRQGRPLSSMKYLRRYERWRKGDNLLMMSSMDIIHKIFLTNQLPIISLRSAGMNWIDRSLLIKNQLNRHAMGIRDDLPLLAKRQVCW